ncbi:MAG: ABC transporter ATP-binding protein, partial [Oscillospiraceae bacterium]|nr:ABC transporter ATP-binding protein [Oscillospiraceae bacterium]
GFVYIDFKDLSLGTCWIYGKENEVHDTSACKQKLTENGMKIWQDEHETVWSFEKFTRSAVGLLGAVTLTVSLFTLPVPDTAGTLTALNNPLFVLALLAVMALVLLLTVVSSVAFNRKWAGIAESATFGNRVFTSYCQLSHNQRKLLDVRTYGQYEVLEKWAESEETFLPDCDFDKMLRSWASKLMSISEGSVAIFTGFVYVFTCLKALGGAFGIGSVTQYVSAVTALSQNLGELLTVLAEIEGNAGFLKTTYEFLDIPNSMYQGSLTTEKRSDRQYDVEFRNVSFKYPGSEKYALKNVNMKFKVGNRLAVVGENGSGKTTFIKLLCRLYDPTEGEILLNGIDIRKYNYRDYMDIFSVVFQDFQLMSQPLGANVAGRAEYDRERAEKALIDAGFGDRLAKMEKGLDTMLFKQLDKEGVDVSGGERQKIAIARALYKDSPFIILDEPTAALDPIAEAEIYSKFNDIAGDKTAIYISHRLSSCKFCDEIAVFHEGGVIQQGSHDSLLLDESGKYYELWNAQAQYYTEKTA